MKLLRNGKSLGSGKYREPLPTQQKVTRPEFQPPDTDDSEVGGINDETSSTSSEKYERDVTVLNHCFDDIEKFIEYKMSPRFIR